MTTSDDWLDKGFGRIFPTHVSAMAELFVVLRRTFDGDLDAVLILAVIGDRKFSRRDPSAELSLERLGSTRTVDVEAPAINVSSISDYTGIPRESVRRKVAKLIEQGWVEREDNRDLRPTPKAAEDLKEATDATLSYLRTVVTAAQRSTQDDDLDE
jgi:DNA-binding MarR family transcriptional regulator